MNKKLKKNLIRIIITSVWMIAMLFIPVTGPARFILYLIPYILIGYDVLKKAVDGIIHHQPFDEGLLMAIATIGAMVLAIIGDGDYTEAIAVMLFYQIGEWFQAYAVGKSRKSISDLMNLCPEYANLLQEDGSVEQVDPDEVEIGSVIVVYPGEKIAIDGTVVEGNSALDTAALTGESLPREVGVGDAVISGCINQQGVIKIRTEKEFDDSTASKIIELIEDASSKKAKSEDFIAKFARVYTPVVVYSAIALAVVPALVLMILGRNPMWGEWIYRALTFLVISCPCALVMSIPLSFFAGIGGASKAGVLVKGSNYLEILSNTKTVVFDKTGTLTKGSFEVVSVHAKDGNEDALLEIAANAESFSTHPIAKSVVKAAQGKKDLEKLEDVSETAGRGIQAVRNGKTLLVGNHKLMKEHEIAYEPSDEAGTVIYVALDDKYLGSIVIADVEKEHAEQAIASLKQNGVKKTVMLTGDAKKVAENVASKLGVDEVYAELLPQDKVMQVEKFIEEKQNLNDVVAFVGDGINDAPVLSRSDIGIAMGGLGSDAAIEAADIVLMDDDPLKIVTAIRISRKCLRIVKENIYFAIGVKVLCLILGALGITNMWAAIFADVGVMMIAVVNAIRCLSIRDI